MVVCAREMLPTGISQMHSTGPSYSSAYPMLAGGSSFPMLAAGSAMPVGMGSGMWDNVGLFDKSFCLQGRFSKVSFGV